MVRGGHTQGGSQPGRLQEGEREGGGRGGFRSHRLVTCDLLHRDTVQLIEAGTSLT